MRLQVRGAARIDCDRLHYFALTDRCSARSVKGKDFHLVYAIVPSETTAATGDKYVSNPYIGFVRSEPDEFCIKIDELCIEIDAFCIRNEPHRRSFRDIPSPG